MTERGEVEYGLPPIGVPGVHELIVAGDLEKAFSVVSKGTGGRVLDGVRGNNLSRMVPIPAPLLKSRTWSGHPIRKRLTLHGMRISIENPAGSYREGTDPDGKPWRSLLHFDYGYLRGTVAPDGDHVDCFLGPNLRDSQNIFIIHQRNVKTGKYDEDKVMLGWLTQTEAVRDYLKNYDRRDMYLGCTKMGIDEFKLKCPRTNDKPRKITSDTPMRNPIPKMMIKAHVKAHTRRSSAGKISTVREHTDSRAAAHISVNVGDTWNSPRGKVTVNKVEGDRTFASYADSPSINHIIPAAILGRWIKQDEQHAARASKQAVAAEEAAKPKRYSTDEFTNRMGGVAGGRARKVLQTRVGLNGKHDTRANHIEKLVSGGYTVKTDNPKKERRLISPSGSFFNQRAITQTGMDYAEHLVRGKKLSKAHVKAHTRRMKSGRMVQIREYQDRRSRKQIVPPELSIKKVLMIAKTEWENREKRPARERLYVRWSSGSEYSLPSKQQNSTDYQTGVKHEGLSAGSLVTIIESEVKGRKIWWPLYDTLLDTIHHTLKEYNFLPGKCFIVRGKQVGTDSDGAPTIRVETVLGIVPRDVVDSISRESQTKAVKSMMIKSRIKAHTRMTRSGKVVSVREHEDSRSKAKSISLPRNAKIGVAIEAFKLLGLKGNYYIRWDEKSYRAGEKLPPSRKWINGTTTNTVLAGTAVIDPSKMRRSSRSDLNTSYMGDVYLVRGRPIKSGIDPGEVILKEAEVVGRLGKIVPVREHEDSRTVQQEMHQRSVKAGQAYHDWLSTQPEAIKEADQLVARHKGAAGALTKAPKLKPGELPGHDYAVQKQLGAHGKRVKAAKEESRIKFLTRWTTLYARRDQSKGASPYIRFAKIGLARPTKIYTDFGVAYEYWVGEDGYGIRVKDTDSDNVIHLISYPAKNRALAEAEYAKTVSAAKKAGQ